MKIEWSKQTLAENIKRLRGDLGLSQEELAERTGISYRLIQKLEGGTANPTMDTVHKLAKCFTTTVSQLIALTHIRLRAGDTSFIQRFQEQFKSASIAAYVRDINGITVWGNRPVDLLHFSTVHFDQGPIDLLEVPGGSSIERTKTLKNQFAAEKNGVAWPYTIVISNPKATDHHIVRVHPTLVFPSKGKVPAFTTAYLTEVSQDCVEHYYEYCKRLLEAYYGK